MKNLKCIFLLGFSFFILFPCSSLQAQDEDFNKLVEKIFDKDEDGLKSLIKSGINVDIRNSSGNETGSVIL